MSCYNNNKCYLPQPPRAWSRVQNSCSLITDTDNTPFVTDPYTRQLISRVALAEKVAMLNKGNILQYKANSSNLTKSQKYSKIAKGQWTNRNTTWATQSTRGYTNPNTTSLKRSGNINVAIDPITGAIIGPTLQPPTCPSQNIPEYPVLPTNITGGNIEPNIPPPINPSPDSNTFPNIIPIIPIDPIVIQDEGILLCSLTENICTGEIKGTLAQQLCHPTTDSDVPGPIQELCWNDGTPTWYPRSRYIMTNSGTKWPVNAELFSSIVLYPPFINSITSNNNIITLKWNLTVNCLPDTLFNIYQNGLFLERVPGTIFSTTITVNSNGNYQFYIISENITANAVSPPSNVVSIDISNT